jgi:hypothetical protein
MQVFFARMNNTLFAPSTLLVDSYLAAAADLADLERREASLEALRRQNMLPRH